VAALPVEVTSLPGVERILLIEDDAAVSSGLSAALTAHDIEVRVLSRGADAVSYAERFLPDVVVLDIGLPDMSGWDVMSELRKKFPSLPVVISSGHAVESDALGTFSSAVVIRKPYATANLLAAIRGVISD
jgi:DNA-binding response OmpR family regulator